jgi:hypothetical protein
VITTWTTGNIKMNKQNNPCMDIQNPTYMGPQRKLSANVGRHKSIVFKYIASPVDILTKEPFLKDLRHRLLLPSTNAAIRILQKHEHTTILVDSYSTEAKIDWKWSQT